MNAHIVKAMMRPRDVGHIDKIRAIRFAVLFVPKLRCAPLHRRMPRYIVHFILHQI